MSADEARAGSDIEEAVAFQRDLYLYWSAVREIGELALTSRGFLGRPTLRRLRAQWSAGDDDRAEADDPRMYFLRRLLERLGLIRTLPQQPGISRNAQLVTAEPAMMARYLAHPLAERLRICARLWVAGGWWADGNVGGVADGLHTPIRPRIALARRHLLELLAALEPGDTVEIPGASTTSDRAPRIIGATSGRRKPRDIADERNQAMRTALAGPLHWMGLVIRRDGGHSGEQRLVVSHAALALRADPDDAAVRETPGRVIIQPNLDVLAYPPLTAPVLFTLDSCASRGKLDRVAHYRLTQDDMTRAQHSDLSEDEIVRRLETLAGSPLPGNVRVRLADWTRAAIRLRFTVPAALLTTSTPALLDALEADRNASGWLLRRLGPTIALIHTGEVESVRRWLLARGELPAVENAPS